MKRLRPNMWIRYSLVIWMIGYGCMLQAQDSMATVRGAVADQKGSAIELVNVVVKEDQSIATTTNAAGNYQLRVPAGRPITLLFTYLTKPLYSKTVTLKANETSQVSFQVQSSAIELKQVVVTDQSSREIPSLSEVKIKEILLPDATGDISSYLASQVLGMNKSNELSSNYAVRGGNFDENLVYVNDFEIYRPYLVRSGQQEGLSFPNPSLISGLKFSSGGFQSKYGDKLSSVMDVTYKHPKCWGGSFTASLLGVSAHVEGCSRDPKRFSFLIGVRQKTSQYILGGLDTKGAYSPSFIDAQLFATAQLSEKWSMELISNVASNKFDFAPDTRQANYGTVTATKGILIAFEGQESDKYLSVMNGLSGIYSPKQNIKIKFLGSVYQSSEKERFDIISQYFVGDVQGDPSKDNYGKVTQYQGIGTEHKWARNSLNTEVYNLAHRGSYDKGIDKVLWGVDYKHEVIHDKLYEWTRLDSGGYSLPYNNQSKSFYGDSTPSGNTAQIKFWDIKAPTPFNQSSNRFSAFIQDNIRFGANDNMTLTYGARLQYWDVNKELVFTPRVQYSIKPKLNKDFIITVASGLYYQPPFYREMRDADGNVKLNLRAQKSYHAVLGFNYSFSAWHRPFNFVTEAYYKYLWDIVPYEYDNTLIRYDGKNHAVGYATGVDLRLNGELVEGAESYISLSLLNTANVIDGATKTVYRDSLGHEIQYVTAETRPQIHDTLVRAVGWQPRPSDQLVTFNLFFQDYIPKWPFIRFNLNVVFGSGIPVKSPGPASYYRSDSRLPFYRRVDMGFAGKLWDCKWAKKKTKSSETFKSVWLSLDVVNIFDINNTVSYQWIKDINVNQYAVPNYLVGRRINVKLVINFGKCSGC
jgi:CarboxypepD_reg-like domain